MACSAQNTGDNHQRWTLASTRLRVPPIRGRACLQSALAPSMTEALGSHPRAPPITAEHVSNLALPIHPPRKNSPIVPACALSTRRRGQISVCATNPLRWGWTSKHRCDAHASKHRLAVDARPPFIARPASIWEWALDGYRALPPIPPAIRLFSTCRSTQFACFPPIQ